MPERSAPLSVDELRQQIEAGTVDTVVVAITDMQGRLQGKRFHARFFLDDVLDHGTEACDYLLATDVEMNTVAGYRMSSWETGYGDMGLRPDYDTLRLLPWHPGTALVLADVVDHHGDPVPVSPRQVLRRQLDRLAERGMVAMAGTELELIVFGESYEQAWSSGYRGLTPINQYNVDYSMLGTARIEPLVRRIRNDMYGAGLTVESSKGECNLGQHEIAFRYADALTTADHHSIYKNGAKEIAAQEGCSLTFMAKYDDREGSSCHVHLSLWGADGRPLMAGDGPHGFSDTMTRSLAGQLACLRDLTLLLAPNVNSYKRFAEGSFAPTAIAWGSDNRTCALRVVGEGPSMRFEHRLPGADVNPYLVLAAVIAASLHGIDEGVDLPEPMAGNAYLSDSPRVPTTLRDAVDAFASSAMARAAFGDDVVDHYATAGRIELEAFERSVTDWERVRGFERL